MMVYHCLTQHLASNIYDISFTVSLISKLYLAFLHETKKAFSSPLPIELYFYNCVVRV